MTTSPDFPVTYYARGYNRLDIGDGFVFENGVLHLQDTDSLKQFLALKEGLEGPIQSSIYQVSTRAAEEAVASYRRAQATQGPLDSDSTMQRMGAAEQARLLDEASDSGVTAEALAEATKELGFNPDPDSMGMEVTQDLPGSALTPEEQAKANELAKETEETTAPPASTEPQGFTMPNLGGQRTDQ